jgi:predicted ester cyclase
MLTGADTAQLNKAVVRRLIDEVLNAGRLDALEELYTPQTAGAARRWIEPFRAAFPDVQMEIVELIAEGDMVVGRFRCSGTHRGVWRGHPPTGRRFERVDEVYFFELRDGRIARAWGLEDTDSRRKQLGLRD